MVSKKSIATKIYWTIGLLLAFLVVIMLYTYYSLALVKTDGLYINLEGRQRMLTQKISKEILKAALGLGNPKEDAKAIQTTLFILESTLDALLNGGKVWLDLKGTKVKEVPPIKAPTVRKALKEARDALDNFKNHVDILVGGLIATGKVNGELKYVLAKNMDLLKKMHHVVVTHQKEYEKKLSNIKLLQTILTILALILSIWGFSMVKNDVLEPLLNITTTIVKSAENLDLTLVKNIKKQVLEREDEIGKLAKAFNNFVIELKKIISHLYSASKTLSKDSAEVEELNVKVYRGIENVSENMEMVKRSLSDNVEAIKLIASSGAVVRDTAETTMNKTEEGRVKGEESKKVIDEMLSVLNDTFDEMKNLEQKSKEIDKILKVVGEIANQTDLLALNAAIEAARAGDLGKGFAVVAEEVRKLAVRSAQSAEEIAKIVASIQASINQSVAMGEQTVEKANNGKQVIDQIIEFLNEINEDSKSLYEKVAEIAAAVEELSSTNSEIENKVDNVADMIVMVTEQTGKMRKMVDDMIAIAKELSGNAQRFKV